MMDNAKQTKKIILIEDHENLRMMMKHLLEDEGFNIIALECAEDFDDEPKTKDADAYIVDLTLPGEDGLNFVKRLKNSHPSSFVVLTTARSKVEDRILGYSTGANVYLPKPVEPSELISILRSQFNLSTKSGKEGTLDVQSQILKTNLAEIELSFIEILILSKLISAESQMLESWQLIALYSDENDNFSLEALQMRLSRLRKKLKDAGLGKRALRSERGIGYKLTSSLILN